MKSEGLQSLVNERLVPHYGNFYIFLNVHYSFLKQLKLCLSEYFDVHEVCILHVMYIVCSSVDNLYFITSSLKVGN